MPVLYYRLVQQVEVAYRGEIGGDWEGFVGLSIGRVIAEGRATPPPPNMLILSVLC